MAGILRRFEKRLEAAVTFAFTSAFKSSVQPVEIAAGLQREIDANAQIVSRDRTLAPNHFTVHLSPEDHARIAPFGATLINELATLVDEHVKEQRYALAGPLAIDLVEDDTLRTGRFSVESGANPSVRPSPRTSATRPAPSSTRAAKPATPSTAPINTAPTSTAATDTVTRRASVVVEVAGVKQPVGAAGIVVGRGADTDLKIDDPGISRRHAQIQLSGSADQPTVQIRDLGSTNGIVIDGRRVDNATLHDGTQVKLGNTTLTVHISSDDAPHHMGKGR